MFKKILVATDGSNHAFRALDIASDLAKKYGAELLIVHILMHGKVPHGFRRMAEVEHIGSTQSPRMEDLYNLPGNLLTTMRNIEPEVNEDEYFDFLAKHIITNSKTAAKENGVDKIDARILSGDVAERILALISSEQIDLVILGTRGIGGIKRMLMGSVASKVSQLAECPCLTVR